MMAVTVVMATRLILHVHMHRSVAMGEGMYSIRISGRADGGPVYITVDWGVGSRTCLLGLI